MDELNQYLKNRGENIAFTFKGLYKMHDFLKKEQTIATSICFICSSLPIFGIIQNTFVLKLISFLAMSSTVWLLHRNSEYQKIENYSKLANEFKFIYDFIHRTYLMGNSEIDIQKLDEDIAVLNQKTCGLPISKFQYKKVRREIRNEMDLEWIIRKEIA